MIGLIWSSFGGPSACFLTWLGATQTPLPQPRSPWNVDRPVLESGTAVAGSSAHRMHWASPEVPWPYWPVCSYSTVDVAPGFAITVHPGKPEVSRAVPPGRVNL